jgi:beta-glucosidase
MGYASGPSAYESYSIDIRPKYTKARSKLAAKQMSYYFFGKINHLQDCEGADREEYKLPFGQDELLNELLKVNLILELY